MGRLPSDVVREVLVRTHDVTDPRYGCRPGERPMREHIRLGVINLDKPIGPTSHEIVAWVKRVLEVRRAGHSGTLDPKVSGVLPVALGDATKLTQALLPAGKEYTCVMHLHGEVPRHKLEQALREFEGEVYQRPPVRAAVKRALRKRRIYYIELLECEGRDVLMRIGCEAGTYARKLCLSPHTELFLTNGGLVRIKDLVESPGFTKDGRHKACRTPTLADSFQIGDNDIVAFQKLSAPKEMVKITTSSGISLEVTPEHDILIDADVGSKWCPAGKLKKIDFIYSPRVIDLHEETPYLIDLLDEGVLVNDKSIKNACKEILRGKFGNIRRAAKRLNLNRRAFFPDSELGISVKNIQKICENWDELKKWIGELKGESGQIVRLPRRTVNEDLAYLLGLLASDGCIVFDIKRHVRPHRIIFHNTSAKLKDEFVKLHKKLFPEVPIHVRRVRKDLFEVKTDNFVLAGVAFSLGIRSPNEESELAPLLTLPKSAIAAFLRGYFDGDGLAFCKKKTRTKAYDTFILFTTANYKTSKRLYQLLKRIGIRSKILPRKTLGGFHQSNSRAYDVVVNTPGDKLRFMEEIGSFHPHKRKVFERIKKVLKRHRAVDDFDYVSQKCVRLIKTIMGKHNVSRNQLRCGGSIYEILNEERKPIRYIVRKILHRFDEIGISDMNLDELKKLCEGQYYLEKIKSIRRVKANDPHVFDLTVDCTHNFIPEGAIVVSNCFDIGEVLGCGAHMAELRRTRAGPFREDETLTKLHDLADAYAFWREEGSEEYLRRTILPVEAAVGHLPKLVVRDGAVDALCHGASLAAPGVLTVETGISQGDLVALMTLKGELISLARAEMASKQICEADHGIVAKPERVVMSPGVYPKKWK